jgi:uncharacterized damage-inducible protein DinB
MEPAVGRIFLDCSARRLTELAARLDDCLSRLDEEQIWMRGGDNQNAAGNLALHLAGNVRQWIVAGVGGAPDVRGRDAEFAAREGLPAGELRARLAAIVRQAAAVIAAVPAARLAERVQIQGYEVTVLEAIYHVVEHFAQHSGQIVFLTKALTGDDLGYYAHLTNAAHGRQTPWRTHSCVPRRDSSRRQNRPRQECRGGRQECLRYENSYNGRLRLRGCEWALSQSTPCQENAWRFSRPTSGRS